MIASVLIVESDSNSLAELLAHFEKSLYHAIGVTSQQAAIEALAKQSIGLVITELPTAAHQDSGSSDALEQNLLHSALTLHWLKQLREAAPRVPVVLITRPGTEQIACEALLRGAATYVPRSVANRKLLETVEQVFQVSKWTHQATEVDECIDQLTLSLSLPSREDLVPIVISKLEAATGQLGLFDDMVWTQVAMALDEAILNAMIHGNLEVQSGLREVGDGSEFWNKIRSQRKAAPFAHRRTQVSFSGTRSQAVFVVRDEGPGFDIKALPDPNDPANLENIGGRGLLLIAAFMDEVHYNDQGNELTMVKRRASGSDETD